MLVKKLLAT